MKLFKTIIAFASIYCFVTVLLGTILLCRYLNTFTPALDKVPIFTITLHSIKSSEQCKITIKNAPYSGFTTLFSAEASPTLVQERLFPCGEYSLILSSLTFDKQAIPLVYDRLVSFRDLHPDEAKQWLVKDEVIDLLLANKRIANFFHVQPSIVTIPLPLASDTTTQYSIVEDESGVLVIK